MLLKKEQIRLFVAIDITNEVTNEIARVQAILQKKNFFSGRYVQPAIAHLTLKFIGPVNHKDVLNIQTILRTIRFPKQKAQLGELGLFSVRGRHAVLFMNIICDDLPILAKNLDEALGAFGSTKTQSFVNHITIARIKSVCNHEAMLKFIEQYKAPPIDFIIDSFVLKRSVLSAQGPNYDDIERYYLI